MLLCISEVAVNNNFTNYTSVSTFCSFSLFLGTSELFQGTLTGSFPTCLEGLRIQSVLLAPIFSYNIKALWEPYHLLHYVLFIMFDIVE